MVRDTCVARPSRAIGLVMAVGLLMSACGDGDNGGGSEVVTRPSVGEFGSDMSVTGVFASDDVAWASALSADDSEGLWQLSTDGSSNEVGGLLDSEWVLGPTFDGGLAVGRFRCGDRAGAPCGGGEPTTAEVELLDRQGESITSAELWSEDGAVGDGTTIAYVGSTSEQVWVRSNQELLAISRSGDVTERLPSSQGLECIVDGQLYSLSIDRPAGASAQPDAPEVIGSSDAQTASSSVTATVHQPANGDWEEIDGQRREIEDRRPQAHCERDGIVLDRGDEGDPSTLASWTPVSGWSPAATPRDTPIPTEVRADSAQGTFFLATDGAVLTRAVDGSLESTGLELPAVGGPSEPIGLAADSSPQVRVACVSTIAAATRNACDVTDR